MGSTDSKVRDRGLPIAAYGTQAQMVALVASLGPKSQLKGMVHKYTDFASNSPLIMSVAANNKEIVDLLLKTPFVEQYYNNRNREGLTAWHMAVIYGRMDVLKMLDPFRQTTKPDRPALNPDIRDVFGNTPLISAIRMNNPNMVQYLLRVQCDAGICGHNYARAALDPEIPFVLELPHRIAEELGFLDIYNMIMEHVNVLHSGDAISALEDARRWQQEEAFKIWREGRDDQNAGEQMECVMKRVNKEQELDWLKTNKFIVGRGKGKAGKGRMTGKEKGATGPKPFPVKYPKYMNSTFVYQQEQKKTVVIQGVEDYVYTDSPGRESSGGIALSSMKIQGSRQGSRQMPNPT